MKYACVKGHIFDTTANVVGAPCPACLGKIRNPDLAMGIILSPAQDQGTLRQACQDALEWFLGESDTCSLPIVDTLREALR